MLKKYEDYKETQISYLGSLPSHWNILPLRSILFERKEKNIGKKNNEILSVMANRGVILYSEKGNVGNKASDNIERYNVVYEDDIVLNCMNVIIGSVGRSPYNGVLSPVYYVLVNRNTQTYNTRYYDYVFKLKPLQSELKKYGKGILAHRMRISMDSLKSLNLPCPPIEEQNQVVKYLDWKLSKINKLIRAKKKQIVLLNEQKQVIINNAVTKGLDPNVPMKDSGIEWIGQIPIHWNVIRLRGILSPVSIKNHPKLPLLSVLREKGVIVRDVKDKESNHNFIPDDLSGYKVVQAGQFVMNKMKAWQGSYGISPYTGIVSPAYFVFDVNVKNKDYFHYSIRSKVYVNFFAQASNGIRVGQWDLNISKMKDIPFIVPSEEEQTLIIDYIKRTSKDIEVAITRFSNEIKLLQEYRTRLISDVVTGKVDVRDIEIPEYEADSDETIDDEIDDNLVLDEEDGEMEVE